MSNKLLLILLGVIALPVALVAYAYHSHLFFLTVMSQHAFAVIIGVLAFFYYHPKHPTVVPTDPPHGCSSGDRFRPQPSPPNRVDDNNHRRAA